jgi:hypothetical protein
MVHCSIRAMRSAMTRSIPINFPIHMFNVPYLPAYAYQKPLPLALAYLEGELKRLEQHHTIALKEIVTLKRQLAQRG